MRGGGRRSSQGSGGEGGGNWMRLPAGPTSSSSWMECSGVVGREGGSVDGSAEGGVVDGPAEGAVGAAGVEVWEMSMA